MVYKGIAWTLQAPNNSITQTEDATLMIAHGP